MRLPRFAPLVAAAGFADDLFLLDFYLCVKKAKCILKRKRLKYDFAPSGSSKEVSSTSTRCFRDKTDGTETFGSNRLLTLPRVVQDFNSIERVFLMFRSAFDFQRLLNQTPKIFDNSLMLRAVTERVSSHRLHGAIFAVLRLSYNTLATRILCRRPG